MADISPTDDRIDSRDVEARFEELAYAADNDFIDEDEKVELKSLAGLILKGLDLHDWNCGAVLIHETHFTDYVTELQQEVHSEVFDTMPDVLKVNIDWNGVAEDLRSDYTVIEWEGETFYTSSN